MIEAWSGVNPGVLSGTRTRSRTRRCTSAAGCGPPRAGRCSFRLPLSLPDHRPDLAEYYTDLCLAADLQPFVLMPPAVNRGMIYLHEDPERGWAGLGSTSSGRRSPTVGGPTTRPQSSMHLPGVQTLEQVRGVGPVPIPDPRRIGRRGPRLPGLRPDRVASACRRVARRGGVKSVRLLTDAVLPALG